MITKLQNRIKYKLLRKSVSLLLFEILPFKDVTKKVLFDSLEFLLQKPIYMLKKYL